MIGKIYPKNSLFLRQEAGEATLSTGETYTLTNLLNGVMLIESIQTGKYFQMPWEDVIRLAREAGIDQEDEDVL